MATILKKNKPTFASPRDIGPIDTCIKSSGRMMSDVIFQSLCLGTAKVFGCGACTVNLV